MSRPIIVNLALEDIGELDLDSSDYVEAYIQKLEQENNLVRELLADLIDADENEAWRYPTIWESKMEKIKDLLRPKTTGAK